MKTFSPPFSFYGYIPFNNKYSDLLSEKLIDHLTHGDVEVKTKNENVYSKHTAYSLDLGFDNFDNVLLMKGVFSTRYFIVFAAAMDAISLGATKTYMLALNDGSDDIVFINKKDGKILFDLCEKATNKKCVDASVGVNSDRLSDNEEEKVKYILKKLTDVTSALR
jgi:hypothetical protein